MTECAAEMRVKKEPGEDEATQVAVSLESATPSSRLVEVQLARVCRGRDHKGRAGRRVPLPGRPPGPPASRGAWRTRCLGNTSLAL